MESSKLCVQGNSHPSPSPASALPLSLALLQPYPFSTVPGAGLEMGSAPASKYNLEVVEQGWIGGVEEGGWVLEGTGKVKEGPVHHTTAVQTPFTPATPLALPLQAPSIYSAAT